jgi:PAS domain S-box-containing protein
MTKILLVEDNEINRDMLSRRLQRQDYKVILAFNGAESVSKALAEKPDLILMDMNLPVMDGWEATRQLKANSQTRDIPVIALTAYSMHGDREKALAAGCDEYESKPIDFPRLLEKMSIFIHKKSQQAPLFLEIPQDNRIQKAFLSHLRHELCTPINAIIGYSEILLDELKHNPQLNIEPNIYQDIEKIYISGNQLLALGKLILDPARLELRQDRNFENLGSAIRLEMLTPLSTIIGYTELLIEESGAQLSPDLNVDFNSDFKSINTAAQKLLSMINDIVNLAQQQLQTIDIKQLETNNFSIENQTTVSTHIIQDNNSASVQSGMILVIDNNQTNCDLLSRQLNRQGYTVTVATNGQQALEILQSMPYDLILLDILMPGMSGLEILSQLKNHSTWQHIPVIMISALDEIDSVTNCIQLGAEDYLFKPFKPVLLRARISACFEKKRLRKQNDELRIAEESYRSIFENALQGIYQSTPDGRLVCVNQAMANIYGLNSPTVMLETLNTIGYQIYVDFERRQEFYRLLEAQGQVTRVEYQVYRYDGEIIWLSESARAVRDINGTLLYYEGIVEEITQRKIEEAALKREVEELRIEIHQGKHQQVTEITQPNYFQKLQTQVDDSLPDNNHQPIASIPTILLVEDNEMNRDMLSRRLKRSGYEVLIAVNGAEGVSIATSSHPDIILMDMSLPVMDGWEATKQLKANINTKHIPIIALTAHAMTGDREKAINSGCDEYDTKPIEMPRLLAKITTLLQKKGL